MSQHEEYKDEITPEELLKEASMYQQGSYPIYEEDTEPQRRGYHDENVPRGIQMMSEFFASAIIVLGCLLILLFIMFLIVRVVDWIW